MIGDSVTSIGSGAFEDCFSLTSIVIKNSIMYIDYYAFWNCDSITEVYYNGTSEEWYDLCWYSQSSPFSYDTLYYYSETEPTEEGNFWHWVDGEVVVWE